VVDRVCPTLELPLFRRELLKPYRIWEGFLSFWLQSVVPERSFLYTACRAGVQNFRWPQLPFYKVYGGQAFRIFGGPRFLFIRSMAGRRSEFLVAQLPFYKVYGGQAFRIFGGPRFLFIRSMAGRRSEFSVAQLPFYKVYGGQTFRIFGGPRFLL